MVKGSWDICLSSQRNITHRHFETSYSNSFMIQIKKEQQPNSKCKYSQTQLEVLLANGMIPAVEEILRQYPELKFKIENGKLVDLVTGAALWLKKFITQDDELLALKQDAMKLTKVDDEVLITGETGTGKELIARSMLGDRVGQFVRMNCGAMPENLIESELFGIVSGAATGVSKNKGLIVTANDGVMFLDEIGDLPLITQAKLLNVLQPIDGKRYVRSVGSTEEREINCRFVCATHKNLKDMVSKGLFRQDLYARISTFELHIKPLKERMDDVQLLIKHIGTLLGMQQDKIEEFIPIFMSGLVNNTIDLSLNIRSIEQAIKRYRVLGKV